MRLNPLRHAILGMGLGVCLGLAPGGAWALDPASAEQGAPAAPDASLKAAERATRRLELEATERFLQSTSADRARLEKEVAGIRSDRARLNATLIETSNRLRATEERITAIEGRLATLSQTEDAIRTSLEGRRSIVVEVLAALQRLGRSPPPVVLVRPEDMLEAVRTSMLLGAVLPELRSETEALASDLAEMVRLRAAAATERDTLAKDVGSLVEDRQRLAALVESRQKELASAEQNSAQEAEKAAALASKAQTLKELIGRLETEIDAAARAADEARRAALSAEEQTRLARESEVKETRDKIAALAFRDPARLAPKLAFSEAKGLLPVPVSGVLLKRFNAPDAVGGTLKGMSYATRPGAFVSAPCDGWVAYAGPFRTYGQLLIINAGGGYYLLLAGMDRINVSLGQFVLAGEPVAVMGEGSQATAASVGSETSQPVLYVEFRKDGISIDPSPWWAASTNEKVRG
ncbi:peptidoglycan DD-metalloendopeptidase family protein [Alsobacter sp. KACC 23698]|uniref:Peptidoglycan DD-metalloendopeptidase family protein n=1 Tax=Alsobacter sp. KACC 23698 TaxID=3149229 RepID=A0AAU7JE11_9HYPH